MSHALQSAGFRTLFRVSDPRPRDASAPEAFPRELPRIETLPRSKQEDSQEKPVSAAPPVAEAASLPPAADRAREPEDRPRSPAHGESKPLRVGIFGRGRLGSAVLENAKDAKGLTVAWALGRGYAPRSPVDVVLDASHADAVRDHVEWAVRTGSDLVIGTSGWSIPDLADLVGDRIGVLTAPNFSLAAALMRRLALVLARFAASYPEADLGITEKHHNRKADAPSGTAKSLAAALVEGCPRYTGWSPAPAAPGKVSVASLRTGYEVGFHEVLLDAPSETMTLTHEARSRDLFARGALEALRWIRGRKGVYSFDDMAAEMLDPLFRMECSDDRGTR